MTRAAPTDFNKKKIKYLNILDKNTVRMPHCISIFIFIFQAFSYTYGKQGNLLKKKTFVWEANARVK